MPKKGRNRLTGCSMGRKKQWFPLDCNIVSTGQHTAHYHNSDWGGGGGGEGSCGGF